MFFKIGVLKNLANFCRKAPVLQSLFNKVAGPAGKTYKNTFFTEHLQ